MPNKAEERHGLQRHQQPEGRDHWDKGREDSCMISIRLLAALVHSETIESSIEVVHMQFDQHFTHVRPTKEISIHVTSALVLNSTPFFSPLPLWEEIQYHSHLPPA